MTIKHPIQPLVTDASRTLRFKENRIVSHLLDWATSRGMGMNQLAVMDFSNEDRQQFAQLIGYSLAGYGELRRYVDDEAYSAAAHMADGKDERDARIAALEEKLAELQADRLEEPSKTPEGWLTWWPHAGEGCKPVYSHGPEKPNYGPEVNARLRMYPVYA